AWSVTRRTKEIGIRMALGAGRKEIFQQLLREGLVVAALGVVLGLALAVPLVLAMRSMLFGVEPGDPQVAASVAAILLVSVLTAVALPAHRATRVDPNVALREE
ncbi:MAG: FtsX-like permease family protein, partial [Thermoanaerobaculia bacterium]